ILTGAGNEEVAIEVMKAGASDYLVKGVGEDYLQKICQTIQNALDEGVRKSRQKLIFVKQQLAEKVFDVTMEGMMVTDADNRIEAVNPAFTAIT
ncbi:MAG: hypothetical protein R8K53_06305, partial [Mariprofundaceae bacterium]